MTEERNWKNLQAQLQMNKEIAKVLFYSSNETEVIQEKALAPLNEYD